MIIKTLSTDVMTDNIFSCLYFREFSVSVKVVVCGAETESRDELIRDVLLWTPTHGCSKAGRPARTYIQQLCEDTGCFPEDLPGAMNDREKWRERVRDIRATSTTWWWWWWYLIFIVVSYSTIVEGDTDHWHSGYFTLLHRGVGKGATLFVWLLHLPVPYNVEC